MSLELIELPSYPHNSFLDSLCSIIDNTIRSLGFRHNEEVNEEDLPKFAIAGGYIRDWYQNKNPNDIDIYLYGGKDRYFQSDRFNEDFAAALLDKSFFRSFFLNKRHKFEPIRMSRTKHFIDTTYTSSDHLPMRVQFILSPIRGVVNRSLRYSSIGHILSSFDFAHCQFAFSPHSLKAFTTPEALSSLESNQLQLTPRMTNEISRLSEHKIFSPSNLFEIEILTKRVIKFIDRGMSLPPNFDLTGLIDSYCCNVMIESLRSVQMPSAMLSEYDFYDTTPTSTTSNPRFTQEVIVKNLIKQWLCIAPIEDTARCLTSPSSFVRMVAEEVVPSRLKT